MNLQILKKAASQLGVKEAQGTKNNPQVVEYHRFANKSNTNKQHDSVPWCASFICWVLEQCGLESTNSMSARSYEKWGFPVKLQEALPGDIFVFHRNGLKSGQGHVTILAGKVGEQHYCLGGNQSDEVNIAAYDMDRLLTVRRASNARINIQAASDLIKFSTLLLTNQKLAKQGGEA